jgi:hypothetical protein
MGRRIWAAARKIRKGKKRKRGGGLGRKEGEGREFVVFFSFFSFSNPFQIFFKPF